MKLFHLCEFTVIERILEKHSSVALELCGEQLSISALRPIPDAELSLMLDDVDDYCLLFNSLPESVSTDSFKQYLQRASPPRDDGSGICHQVAVTSVTYGVHRGTAMVVFQQPYGKQSVCLVCWCCISEPYVLFHANGSLFICILITIC